MNAHTQRQVVRRIAKWLNLLVIVCMVGTMVLPPVSRAASQPVGAPAGPAEAAAHPLGDGLASDAPESVPQTGIAHIENTRLIGTLAITDIYLPIILGDGSEEPPPPPPPEGTEVLVKPGIGGIVGPEDGLIRAEFSRQSVEQDTWVRYEPLARPTIETPGLAVGGPAFTLTAWEDGSGQPVTQFPHQVEIIPGDENNPATSIITPSIVISVRYTEAEVWGLDLRTLSLYTRSNPDQPWERVPTAVYQDQNLLVGESDHLSEFVVMGQPAYISAQETKRLALDPDDDVGHATWPGVGEVREITYNMRLAQEVKQKLEDDKCDVEILITRSSAGQRFVSRSTRAQSAINFGANMFVTLAFDALLGVPWGSSGDGGLKAWARYGHPDDDALGNEFRAGIQAMGRPAPPVKHPAMYATFESLPGTYAHIETLFLDHNYDWPIINTSFSSITDAAYTALRRRLEAGGMTCGDDPNNPPPYPAPPSAAQIQRWRDLGYQNMQTYGTKYDLLYLRQQYQAYGGDPVSFSTGNHIQQITLARIPGRGGLDLDFTLFYNAQDGREDLFGYGWSFPYNIRAQQYKDNSVSIILHDGRTYHYTWNGSGYDAPAGVQERLEKTGDGWNWQTLDGTVLTFKEVIGSRGRGLGVMTHWQDRQGNTLTFEYDLSEQNNWEDGNDVPRPPLTKITDTAGQAITLTNDDHSHITGLSLPDGRSFSFGYDGQGNLTTVTDGRGNTYRYQYDARHRMTREQDPAGITWLQNSYDDRDRVVGQIDASGTPSSLSYDSINGVTTFTDNLGHTTKYFHDELNRITAIEDAQGNTKRYEYDADYNLLKETDARGFETGYTYDANGNPTSRTDPIDGYSAAYYGSDTTTWQYNATNDLVKTTDALGNVTTFDYDGQGNLTAIHQPDGRDTTFTYNAWGQPLTMTDPNGHTTTYEYDAAGNLVKTTDAEGNVTSSTYDAAGRETSYTDANGHTVYFTYDVNDNITRITDPKGRHTDFEYDANDLLVKVADRRGGVTRYEYDENLKLVKETDPEGYTVEYDYDLMYNRIKMTDGRGHTTRYEYDSLYRLTRLIDANGRETRYGYDANGNLTAVIDPLGQRTGMTYDAVNRLKYLSDPLGHRTEYCYDAEDQLVKLFDPRRAETRYEYDGVGNLLRLIDPLGEVSDFGYDPAGNLRFVTNPNRHTTEYVYDRIDRLVREIDPLGHETLTGYDPVGNVTSLTDPNGHTTTFAYDANDNLVTLTDPLGNNVSYAYDEEDNQTAVTDPRGHTTAFAYNLRGLVITVTEPDNHRTRFAYDGNANLVELINAKDQPTRYTYDPVDLLIEETDPLGNKTGYTYDAADRLTTVLDANGHPTTYGYDPADRLVSVTDALNNITRYGYDEVGNLTVITDANRHVTHFEYNFRDELVKEINPLTNTWEYHYDGAGNLTMRRDAAWQPTYYDYDAAGRLVKITYPSVIGSSGREVSFTYDPAGNETSMTDWNGTISHQYDALNRRTRTTNFDGKLLQYVYDSASNLTGLTYPNGDTVTYAYDARNLLSALQDHFHQTITYHHDPLGALTQIDRPNNTTTAYSYDGANRLTHIDHRQNGTGFSAFAYALDKVGNRTQITELRIFTGSGSPVSVTTVKDYSYDALYRLTNAATDQGQDVGYSYDPVGNRIEQSGIPQAVDPTDTVEPIRPAAPIANRYTYNAANQLTVVSDQSSVTDLEYDAKGNRINETEVLTDGTALFTAYTWDHENRLVGVTKSVSDTTAVTTTMVATYTYDGYGRRIEKEVINDPFTIHHSQSTINYLYNGLDPIADYQTAGSVTTATHYLWANGGIAEIERLPNPATGFPGDVHWTHTDGLGSLTDLTDAAGQPVQQVYYDEYGRLLTEFDPISRYSYTGQEYDPETGLYHFYARYYDPENGVWLGQDAYRGVLVNPLSLHRYGYVGGNPVNLTDMYGYYWGEKWVKKGGKALNDHVNPFNSKSSLRKGISNTGNQINKHVNPFNPKSTIRKKVLNPVGQWAYDNRAEIAGIATDIAIGSLVVAGGTALIVASGGTATPLVVAGLGALGGCLGGFGGKVVENKIKGNKWNEGVLEEAAWGTAFGALPVGKIPGMKNVDKFIDKRLFKYAAIGRPATRGFTKKLFGKRALKIFARNFVTGFSQGLITQLPNQFLKVGLKNLFELGSKHATSFARKNLVNALNSSLLRQLLLSSPHLAGPELRKLQ